MYKAHLYRRTITSPNCLILLNINLANCWRTICQLPVDFCSLFLPILNNLLFRLFFIRMKHFVYIKCCGSDDTRVYGMLVKAEGSLTGINSIEGNWGGVVRGSYHRENLHNPVLL